MSSPPSCAIAPGALDIDENCQVCFPTAIIFFTKEDMGCSLSQPKAGGLSSFHPGSVEITREKSVALRRMKGTEASRFTQGLVKVNEQDIHEVYNINWDDDKSVLGSGINGSVRQAVHRQTGKVFALKTIETFMMEPGIVAQLYEEVAIMRILDHPNCIKILETYTDFTRLYVVMECCQGGELFDLMMEEPGQKFNEERAKVYSRKILSALNYLHGNNIIHRDLKLENFLLTRKDDKGELKLIDFGLSRAYLEGESIKRVIGTTFYMSPQVLKGNYSVSADMWSFGVCVFILLSGRLPFGGSTDQVVEMSINYGKYYFHPQVWEGVSDEGKNFISNLLVHDVDKRMTAAQALEHPWMKGGVSPSVPRSTVPDVLGLDDNHLVSRMKEFRLCSNLKRAALLAVSRSLEDDEIASMREAFQLADDNCNGVITHDEFINIMRSHGVMDQQESSALFSSIDQDHTLTITYNEFLAACIDKKQYLDERRIVDAFHKLDIDNRGEISRNNLMTLFGDACSEEEIGSMLDAADFNNDGFIDLDEFRRMMNGETKEMGADAKRASIVKFTNNVQAQTGVKSKYVVPTPKW